MIRLIQHLGIARFLFSLLAAAAIAHFLYPVVFGGFEASLIQQQQRLDQWVQVSGGECVDTLGLSVMPSAPDSIFSSEELAITEGLVVKGVKVLYACRGGVYLETGSLSIWPLYKLLWIKDSRRTFFLTSRVELVTLEGNLYFQNGLWTLKP